MGKFNTYYEQLKNKMADLPQEQGQWRQSLQKAMAAVKAEQEAERPTGAERLEGFDYVQNCNDALMNCAAEKIKKEASWDATVRRVRMLLGKPDLQLPRGSGDWMVSLMKTDGTDESRNYNDKLVGQMALCTGAINPTQYQTLRRGWYDRFNGDFRNVIIAEQQSAAEDLLSALDGLVQKGKRQKEAFVDSVNTVLSLNADRNALNRAFEVIESDEIRIMEQAEDCLNDIRNFKNQYRLPQEKIEEQQEKWPFRIDDHANTEDPRKQAENVADWTYDDMIENFGYEVPAKENKAEQNPAFTDPEKYQLKKKTINDYLERYGLEGDDKFLKNDSGYAIYRSNAGDTVIMKVDEVKAGDGGGVRYEIRDDAPGRYVTYDFDEKAREAAIRCKLLEDDDHGPHSEEYTDLNKQAEKLKNLKLSDQPGWDEVKEASYQIGRFNTLLKKFVTAQEKEKRPKVNGYDTLVKELTDFAGKKNTAISALYEHLATRDRFELNGKEISESIHAAQEKDAGNRPLTSLQNYKIFARSWSETMGAIKESEVAKKFDKFKNSTEDLDKANGVAMKAILGEDLYQAGVKGEVYPEQLANVLGKSALACGVIEQLLKMETKMGIKGTPPIKDLIDNGKLSEVVDMVKNSRSFGENYSFLDLSDCTQKRLDKILAGKEKGVGSAKVVAQDIMKSYLSAARDQKQAAGNQGGQRMENHEVRIQNNPKQVPQNPHG